MKTFRSKNRLLHSWVCDGGYILAEKVRVEADRNKWYEQRVFISTEELQRLASSAETGDGIDVDAILRVATGKLDRGTPEQRLKYIAETCQIILTRQQATVIADGFGGTWGRRCLECGRDSMEVVRPGKVQCSFCG